MTTFSRIPRTQRIALFVLAVLLLVRFAVRLAGVSLPIAVRIALALVVLILIVIIVTPLVRMFLWRVRRRLLLTYFLIGVLPITLIAIFVALGFNLVLSETANYLLHSEVDRRLEQLLTTAQHIAQEVSARGDSSIALPAETRALIRTEGKSPANFPQWSNPGYKGVIRNSDDMRFLAAHGAAGNGKQRTEVFIYQEIDNKLLSEFLPGLASVYVVEGTQVSVTIGRRRGNANAKIVLDSEEVALAPSSRGFWDVIIESSSPLYLRSMDDGKSQEEAIALVTTSSALLRRLFSTLGPVAAIMGLALLVIALIFLVVEIVAIAFSFQLTRTITRVVNDLDLGTKKVQSGDFGHRIPVRSNEQLSELATSFNTMTSRIQKLLAEVKDKEKLEAELEIARQVQAQLFP